MERYKYPNNEKRCKKCKQDKHVDEFYDNKSSGKIYKFSECKLCNGERGLKWQDKNRKKHLQYKKDYNQREDVKKARKHEKKIERKTLSGKARKKLQKVVKLGRIIKPSICENCNKFFEDKGKIHGHHKDYNKPLDVDWLCQLCHSELHNEEWREYRLEKYGDVF